MGDYSLTTTALSGISNDFCQKIDIEPQKITIKAGDTVFWHEPQNLTIKEEESMNILKIYKENKIKKIKEEFEEKRKEIINKDKTVEIYNKAMNEIKKIFESDNVEFTHKWEWILYTKETKEKLNDLDKEFDKQYDKLNAEIKNIEALLEMTDLYEDKIQILRDYDIIEKNKVKIKEV